MLENGSPTVFCKSEERLWADLLVGQPGSELGKEGGSAPYARKAAKTGAQRPAGESSEAEGLPEGEHCLERADEHVAARGRAGGIRNGVSVPGLEACSSAFVITVPSNGRNRGSRLLPAVIALSTS
eukprot:3294010-Rhodomonas_salina.2